MAWTPRTRDAIRDAFLADWGARAEAALRPIDTRAKSPAWVLASALALVLESQEAQLATLADELLPDRATTSFLDRHGAVEGLPRDPAVAAVLEGEVLGTPLATVTFGSATLAAPNGQVYVPSANLDGTGGSVVLDGAGKADAYFTARAAGTEGNQPTGTTLTWSSPPADAFPTAGATGAAVVGAAIEGDASYALRIIARRQERPASGNRADWVAWATEVTGVDDAVVYPLLHPTYGTETPGAVTLVPLGPAQGDAPTNSRIVSSDLRDAVAGYIEGDNDADGGTTGVVAQKRPVTMAPGDYAVEAAAETVVAVEVKLTLAPGYAPVLGYDASRVVLATSTTTLVKLAGDLTAVYTTAIDVLVHVGTSNYRGGYYLTRPTAVNLVSGDTHLTVPTLPGTPVTGEIVLPAPPEWARMRTVVFAFFDRLGPGDTSPAARWPGEASRLRSKIYKPALAAAFVAQFDTRGALAAGVAGVLSAEVLQPAATVEPAEKTLATLGAFAVRE